MSCGSLSQFSPNLQQPMPTIATLSRMASILPMRGEATTRELEVQPGRRRRGAPRASAQDDGFDVHELAQPVLGELAAVARLLDAAERQAWIGADLRVHRDRACVEPRGDPLGSRG